MSLASWLSWTFSPSHARRAQRRHSATTAPRRRHTFRPSLETLEDRCLLNAGALDPTFGNGAGYVTTSAGSGAGQVLIQPSGTIIVAGSTTITVTGDPNPVPAFGVVAYNPNGSLDTAFGSGGIVQQPFAGNAGAIFECATLEPMGAGDDDILLAGKVNGQGGLAVMRLTANGTLDTTFGSNGQVVTLITTSAFGSNGDVGEGARSIAVMSTGQILVAGWDGIGTVVIAEYNSNGTLDTSFGSGGTTTFDAAGTYDLIHSVAAQSNGDVVLAGEQRSGTQDEGLLLRYNANGSLDSSFGNGGVVTTEIPSAYETYFEGVAIDPSTGQIVVAADDFTNFNQQTGEGDSLWAAARYNSNGSLDTTFGNGGSVIIPDPQETSPVDIPGAVALQSDGDVVLVGLTSAASARVDRLTVNGSLDATFGNGGVVTTPVGSKAQFNAVAIQPNGDIVAAGWATIGSEDEFLVARYLGQPTSPYFVITGSTSLTAGTTGTFTLTTLNPDGSADTGYSGTVQITSSDGKAVLPGNLAISGGTGTFNVTLETAGTQSVTATDVNNSSMTGVDTGIAVSPAAASQVVFTQEPASGTAGQTLGTVQAAIEDAYGNIETGDTSDKVTVSVNSGPSTQIGGTLTETVAAGIATFSNLLLDTSGSYRLAALATLAGVGPAVSSSFTMASPVSLAFGTITYNSRTHLYSETLTLTNTTSGTLTGPMSVELTNLPSGVTLTDDTGTTNGNPYLRFLTSGKTLKKGASASITLTFTAASLSDITFDTEVVVGL